MSSRVHGGLLVALAWGVYAIGIQAPFLLDDNVFITNPTSGIGDLWSFDDYRNRPVMMLSLSLNYAIAGAEPAAFRLVNILIHTDIEVEIKDEVNVGCNQMHVDVLEVLQFASTWSEK